MTAIVLRGDAAHLPLEDGSVDLICTSPPYWKLRDYRDDGQSLDGQIGGEAGPGEYIAKLLECTREWMRVLKPGGSCFVVLGDKYSQPGKGERNMQSVGGGITHKVGTRQANVSATGISYDGFPAKSLLFLPERYRIGCVTELGLIARAKIVWSKPNHMPESIEDRVCTAHEDIVHLVKQPRYFAAVDEVREPHTMKPQRRPSGRPEDRIPRHGQPRQSWPTAQRDEAGVDGHPLGKLPGSVWEIPTVPLLVPSRVAHAHCCAGRERPGCKDGLDHFAAYPPELCRRIILGWSPSGICLECGEGRWPVVTAIALDLSRPQARRADRLAKQGGLTEAHLQALLSVGISDTGRGAATQNGTGKNTAEVYELADAARTVLGGYAREYLLRRPTSFGYVCACTPFTDHPGSGKPTQRRDYNPGPDDYSPQGTYGRKQAGEYERVGPWREYHLEGWTAPPTRPAVVADPCGGTGTTALVADVLGRTGITFDRSMGYCRLARWRTRDPAERARALGVPKPPPVPEGQGSLFDHLEAS